MDREEKRFLKSAIKVQQSKNLGFSFDGDTIRTCANIQCNPGEPENIKVRKIKLSFLSEEYLINEGFIASQGVMAPLYYVTDKGWNHFRDIARSVFQDITRSILTPVIVSVITTLVTLWIQSRFF